jgi:taurine dioxygenase
LSVVKLTDLTPAMGTEVNDVDLRGSFRADEIDLLRNEYDRRHLLLFRHQQLCGDEQVRFVSRFGPLIAEKRAWGYVSNVRPDGLVPEGGLLFHSDFAFAREPTLGLSLLALEIPPDGAPTAFANAVRAVDHLPSVLRGQLEGRRVLNIYDFHWPGDQRVREHQLAPGSPRTEYPVIGPHPRTGVPVVFANEMHTDRIVGMDPAHSDAVLRELYTVLYGDDNVYEHRWQVGDLILWDNIALHHGRRTIPPDQPRTLQRVAIGNYTPTELVPNLAELLASAAQDESL